MDNGQTFIILNGQTLDVIMFIMNHSKGREIINNIFASRIFKDNLLQYLCLISYWETNLRRTLTKIDSGLNYECFNSDAAFDRPHTVPDLNAVVDELINRSECTYDEDVKNLAELSKTARYIHRTIKYANNLKYF
eukprot:Mrub_13535.p1 GENE.Mrub_13535~~Mrub_13535.p1  ORF type:complete len:135 (+),score=13.12 Mrub_13535:3-407(+)